MSNAAQNELNDPLIVKIKTDNVTNEAKHEEDTPTLTRTNTSSSAVRTQHMHYHHHHHYHYIMYQCR